LSSLKEHFGKYGANIDIIEMCRLGNVQICGCANERIFGYERILDN
jgi:hypothetical protein